jgi:4-amino-4-deoxy-L-arabinose transferase-like glycosyltransferase
VKSVAVRPLLVVLAGMLVLHLAVANRYGWQRDELYYAVAGRHLQGGYVEFPPLTALLSALARVVFGWSLVGFRLFAFVAGMATAFLAALVARELGGGTRAQVLAAAAVGLSPILLATNGLFQPVSFDQTATMLVLWLAVRLALGRGSWPALGVAVGIGLETKYTLAVVLVLLVAAFAVWRRDALELRGLATAVPVAAVLMVPNLVWEAGHAWISVHWFLHPPASATDESRPEYLLDVFLNTHPLVFAVAVTGVVVLWRDRRLRPLAAVVAATVLAYFVLGGKSYYAAPVVCFAVAAGAPALDGWATRRRLLALGAVFVATSVYVLPGLLPVLPLQTAIRHGVVEGRSDYQDELGWPALARQVKRLGGGRAVVVAANYGEAGALELFGHGLPPVASGHVTFRYWRPAVAGRDALAVGFDRRPSFCRTYVVVGRIAMPTANEERGRPLARCTLAGSLAAVWPDVVRESNE